MTEASILFNKENTKVEQSDSEQLYDSSERCITLQRQLDVGSSETQAPYFWLSVLMPES